MKRILFVVGLIAVLTACGAGSTTTGQPASSGATTSAAAAPSSCTLTTTFDYIVRTTQPGTPAQAQKIGNVNVITCADSLVDFQQTAGQGDGECTTIARASDNPGYNPDEVPAPALKHVIESAGPGCA